MLCGYFSKVIQKVHSTSSLRSFSPLGLYSVLFSTWWLLALERYTQLLEVISYTVTLSVTPIHTSIYSIPLLGFFVGTIFGEASRAVDSAA